MKMVMLMYLEEDRPCVERIVSEAGVTVFSRLAVEGRGPGAAGWLGEVPSYASELVVAVVADGEAAALLRAVEDQGTCEDARHPVRAIQVPVEETAVCRGES